MVNVPLWNEISASKVYPFTNWSKWIITTTLAVVITSKEFETRLQKQAFAGPILNFMPVDTGATIKQKNLPLDRNFQYFDSASSVWL